MNANKFRDPHAPERRILVVGERIIYVRELAHPTPEAISESAREVGQLSQDWDRFCIMVEFESLVVPGLEVMHRVSNEVLPIKKKLDHVAVVTQANVFLKVAIKFIARLSGFQNISVHATRESAFSHLLMLKGNP